VPATAQSLSEPASTKWRLTPLHLSPPRRTRPPKEFLATWDIRVRRPTSPFWKPPMLLSPLRESPSRRPARVHRGVQCHYATTERGTQSTGDWKSSADEQAELPTPKESRSTQADAPTTEERQTQTGSPERSYTPPGIPPALRRWGPRTTTQPTIEWRERL